MTRPLEILSCGIGVQSTSILLMVKHKYITPMLDAAIFSDTMAEPEPVYTHLKWIQEESELPFPLYCVSGGNLYTDNYQIRHSKKMDRDYLNNSAPLFVRNHDGSPGLLMRRCTNNYKIVPVHKKIRELVGRKNIRAWKEGDPHLVNMWMGISLDETMRMKTSLVPWIKNVYPLVDRRLTRLDCLNWTRQNGYKDPPRSSCTFCFAGETEVPTKDGIKTIAELAGSMAELLIPGVNERGAFTYLGGFRSVSVRQFGVQQLYKLSLERGRQKRELYCTAEHKWFLNGSQYTDGFGAVDLKLFERTTATLKPGDKLRSVRTAPLNKEVPAPFGVAQGFTFGDGSVVKTDNRAATLVIIEPAKIEALKPYFSNSEWSTVEVNKQEHHADITINYHTGERTHYLPRFWKQLPPIAESRSFLLGWLAGYFAADGSVSDNAQAVLESSVKENLEFVRSVCAILGISCSTVHGRERKGINDVWSTLYRVSIRSGQLPHNFWLRKDHLSKIKETSRSVPDWQVVSVEETDRVEPVYCATVDGVGAFGLTEELLTGNCPYHNDAEWLHLKTELPEDFEKAAVFEERMQEAAKKTALNATPFLHHSLVPIREVAFSARQQYQSHNFFSEMENDNFTSECDGYCGV